MKNVDPSSNQWTHSPMDRIGSADKRFAVAGEEVGGVHSLGRALCVYTPTASPLQNQKQSEIRHWKYIMFISQNNENMFIIRVKAPW